MSRAMSDSFGRQRQNATIPVRHAMPTIMVIAISMGENVPLIRWEIPNRYDQISDMRNNQNRNIGSAIQRTASDRRSPITTAAHNGSV